MDQSWSTPAQNSFADASGFSQMDPLLPTEGGELPHMSMDVHAQHEHMRVWIQLDRVSCEIKRDGEANLKALQDISATFCPGQLVALMGPSGAGKTMLLNTLLGFAPGQVTGKILINGSSRNSLRALKSICCYVPQEDILLNSLSPREMLRYAARLKLPYKLPLAAKYKKVEAVLSSLNLMNCADTRIGSAESRGLSGGERKRTSIALEFLINPSVVFCDEITSGLDSKSAEDVIELLQHLAKDQRLIICTIHQPSFKIFSMFHQLLLLCGGRTVYHGKASQLNVYFSTIGLSAPPYENPIDYYMRLLQDPVHIDHLVSNWEQAFDSEPFIPPYVDSTHLMTQNSAATSNKPLTITSSPDSKLGMDDESSTKSHWTMADTEAWVKHCDEAATYAVPRIVQLYILLQRSYVDGLKDYKKFVAGLMLKVTIGLMVGICWLNQGGDKQENIFTTQGALFSCSFSSVMDTMFPTVMMFPTLKLLLLREYRNGTYSLPSQFLALLISSVTFNAIYAIFLGLPVYFLVGLTLSFERVLVFIADLALMACIGVSLGMLLGSLVRDYQSAQQAIMPTLIPLMLFCGYVIPYNQIQSYLQWLYYASFFQYSLSILEINQYRGKRFSDCSAEDAIVIVNNNTCTCPLSCYETGEQYLSDQHIQTDELGRDFMILLGYFVFINICAYYSMRRTLVNMKA